MQRMHLRALLMCEDVRLEVDGTLTLVGVFNDTLPVRRAVGAGGIVHLEHLAFLLVVGGLTGIEQVGFREVVSRAGAFIDDEPDLEYQPHDRATDEHNFVFGHAPMSFPDFGDYEIAVIVATGSERTTYRHRFRVEPSRFQ